MQRGAGSVMEKVYWEDENDPEELRRRADDLDRDGFFVAAMQLRERARQLDEWPRPQDMA